MENLRIKTYVEIRNIGSGAFPALLSHKAIVNEPILHLVVIKTRTNKNCFSGVFVPLKRSSLNAAA